MLKSIELYGFKSFADRTKMELDGSVCALVGPNGSGKSNVVDAIKWALGEQSAKRLRGDEMTDVIFNGSTTRQSLGSAEVTLSFDNSSRIIPVESDEIHFTRRVYRNGESEYLINGRGARLKDFRDLVGGFGLGSQGYAVIEQGRVEALLQSSSDQRRAVLEEAAGVSRFNAKKQEVLRRLERVEQNLLRLSDLVGEIESQLRKTKAQAGKAETYRKLTARSRQLRAEIAVYEWRVKTEARRVAAVETEDFAAFETTCSAEILEAEALHARLSKEVATIESGLREAEGDLSSSRERIAAEESALEFQRAQIREWRAELQTNRTQSAKLRAQSLADAASYESAQKELEIAKGSIDEIAVSFERENAALEALAARVDALTASREEFQRERETKNAESSRFEGELAGLETQLRSLQVSYDQKRREYGELERQRAEQTAEITRLNGVDAELAEKLALSTRRLEELDARRAELRRAFGERQVEFSELERKRAAFDERSALLNDLLVKYEGLSPGVKEILRAMKNPASPFRNAYGLVADLIRVNVEAAPLVELALGQTAQHVVVPPEPELFRHIERQGSKFVGRVGFVWLDPTPRKSIPLDPKLDGQPGVLGRADQFVETEPMFEPLVQRLLHRTWIVESVAVAKQLYKTVDEPTNFLSADGSLLTADSMLIVGAAQGGAGLISRRSELAALSEETAKLQRDFDEIQSSVGSIQDELARVEAEYDAESSARNETSRALESLRLRRVESQTHDSQLVERVERLTKETNDVKAALAAATSEVESKRAAKKNFDDALAEIDAKLAKASRDLDALAQERSGKAKLATNLKINLAKAEERILSLSDRAKSLADADDERSRRVAEYETRAKTLDERRRTAELAALAAESTIATLYASKERATLEARRLARERTTLDDQRAKAVSELRTKRDALEKRREKIRAQEISCERYAQEIRVVEERVKEDFGVEVSELKYQLEGEVPSADGSALAKKASEGVAKEELELVVPTTEKSAKARRKELDELRGKIRDLGFVNLEAIETLETLKTRYATLFNQYNDLIAARKSIHKILDRVNADCRRLFEETFNAVRDNFNALFQKLFGGGRADLTLENPNNPLESGVDIIARPPGKDLKSLSLMSGGEKSLTCVALLLAIFQHRSSPLCVLDEVDAALDEANVHRFANALHEFIPTTQFILVTHSKKTMSCSKAIYGVTMEDSGVSKILSVHFDDVGENGEILVKTRSRDEDGPRLSQNVG